MKKVGIIGCGGIAKVHAWVLGGMEDVRVTAFCDMDLERARELAETMGSLDGVLICDNWRKVCRADVDVVHLCTPHHLHVPMAIGFLRNGKAVFMEKPCATTAEQFQKLQEENQRYPGKLGFCFQNRYNESTILMDQLVAEKQVGKIIGGRAFVTWRRDKDYYEGSSWKGKIETEGGGALINQSIHTLDLLLRYLGKPKTVKATIANHHLSSRIEVEDTVEAWMAFGGEKRGCFYASTGYAADAPILLELQGEKGRITLNGSEVTVYVENEPPKHYIREWEKGIGKDYWGCGHKACIVDFYRSLRTGGRFQNDLKGVENVFQTVMQIYESARNS